MTIVMQNGDAYLESYFNNGDAPIMWPGVMDTSELALWTAYEATKDDILIVSQLNGATPLIVEAWMGSEQIHPSYEEDREFLVSTIDSYLMLP